MVMVAGPKLKLSILIVATPAGLSPDGASTMELAAALNASAVARSIAVPNINLILFISILLLEFRLSIRTSAGSRESGIHKRQRVVALHKIHMRNSQHA